MITVLGYWTAALALANVAACSTELTTLRRAGLHDGSVPDVALQQPDGSIEASRARKDSPDELPSPPRPVGCAGKAESASTPYSVPWPPWCDGPDGGAASLRALVTQGATPPEHCVAPCLWDVIKNCLPIVPCDASNRVAVYPYFGGHSGYTVCLGDELCFASGAGSVPPAGYPRQWGWTDSKDQEVAWGFSNTSTDPLSTACGPSCFPPLPVSDACASQPAYPVRESDADCAPWEPLLQWLY